MQVKIAPIHIVILPIGSPFPDDTSVSFFINIERVGEGGNEIESLLLNTTPPNLPDFRFPPWTETGCRTLFEGVLADDGVSVIVDGMVIRWCRCTWVGPWCWRMVCCDVWRLLSRSVSWSCCCWGLWLTLFRAFENPLNFSKHFFSTARRCCLLKWYVCGLVVNSK